MPRFSKPDYRRPQRHSERRPPRPKGRAARRLLTAPPFHPPRREKGSHPTVFAYAPTAPDWNRQLACEASFRDAVEANLAAVIVLGESEI